MCSLYNQQWNNLCAQLLQTTELHYIQIPLHEEGPEMRLCVYYKNKLRKYSTQNKIINIYFTFAINSLKDEIFGSDPQIPMWHSYIRSDFGTFGGMFFHLYMLSGGGSQWIAKACIPSASEYRWKLSPKKKKKCTPKKYKIESITSEVMATKRPLEEKEED